MIRKKCVHGRNENEFCSTCSSKHYLNSERAMTDTTAPKPAKDKAMSEQIKPVDRYVVTKDGYLIPLEDGNVVYYSDHAETVQQLQDKVSQLKDALEWEEIAHHAERNKARAEENENTSLREQVQQLQRDLEIQKQRVVDLGVLCLESVPRESLENQRQLYDMAVKGRSDMRSALRSERDKAQQLQQRIDRLLAALKDVQKGIAAVEELIKHSRGVSGLHLNGDDAPWGDLRTGGRFEGWLLDFDRAAETVDAIIAAEGEKG